MFRIPLIKKEIRNRRNQKRRKIEEKGKLGTRTKEKVGNRRFFRKMSENENKQKLSGNILSSVFISHILHSTSFVNMAVKEELGWLCL